MSDLPAVQQAPMIPFSDVERMASAIAASKLFGVKTKDQALGLMLIAQADGRHPASAAMDYHIIDGRPSLKADTMLARFQSAGGTVKWLVLTDAEVTGEFYHPAGGTVKIQWRMNKEAKDAGLTGKDVWKKYPRSMLRSRCIAEAIRTVLPGVLTGMYTPEEIESIPQEPTETAQAEVLPDPPKAEPAPFDRNLAANWIFSVLPADDGWTKLIVEEHGVVLPDCAPAEFRGVLSECLIDQIKDREHGAAIYLALKATATESLDLEFESKVTPDTQPD